MSVNYKFLENIKPERYPEIQKIFELIIILKLEPWCYDELV
jgi:hypothetical protein